MVMVGHSGMSINDQAVMELQILDQEGGSKGFLSQCDDPELVWLEDLLRRQMKLGEACDGY